MISFRTHFWKMKDRSTPGRDSVSESISDDDGPSRRIPPGTEHFFHMSSFDPLEEDDRFEAGSSGFFASIEFSREFDISDRTIRLDSIPIDFRDRLANEDSHLPSPLLCSLLSAFELSAIFRTNARVRDVSATRISVLEESGPTLERFLSSGPGTWVLFASDASSSCISRFPVTKRQFKIYASSGNKKYKEISVLESSQQIYIVRKR